MIATGSVPINLPSMPFDGETVVSSTEALCFEKPPEKFLVIGAGAIGLELGSVWSRLGSEVTVLEFLPRIAVGFDLEVSNLLQRALTAQGMKFHLETKVGSVKVSERPRHRHRHQRRRTNSTSKPTKSSSRSVAAPLPKASARTK